jgi:PAS domain S-box-containing protein
MPLSLAKTSQIDKPLHAQDIALARVASFAAIATGSLDEVGWALRIPALTQIVPGFPTMKPLTGVCFILVGIAVLLLNNPRRASAAAAKANHGIHFAAVTVLAMVVLLIGLATFFEYAGITGSTVDKLLFREAVSAGTRSIPGRISIATATTLCSLAVSLLLLAWPRCEKTAWHQLSAGVAIAAGLIGLLGFGYGSGAGAKFAAFQTMAVHTSAISFLLGLAIFFSKPAAGMMETFYSRRLGGFLARRTLPVAMTLPFFLGWLRLRGQRAGYYGTEFGLAIFACANAMLFGVLVWWTARSLNAVDEQREQVATFDARRREILEVIAKGAALRTVLEQIVLLVEALAPGTRCAISLFDKDKGRLFGGASPSLPGEYCREFDGLQIGPTVGSCGTAAYFGRRVIVEDIETDPLWKDFKHLALAHGLRSCWSSPILTPTKEVLGTFAVYSRTAGPPNPIELMLVDSATDLAAIAIQKNNSEEALSRNEAQLRFLFENAVVGIVLVSSSGHLVKCNPAFCASVGYSPDELRSMRFSEITHAEDAGAENAEFARLLAGSANAFQMRKRYAHKCGKIVFANLNASLIRTASGAPVYGIHIVEDITQRHLAEQESARLQTQMQQAQRIQALGTLAGGIAHDFNNILASIVGNVEFAVDAVPKRHESRPHLERISEAATRATELVRQILAFSRLQAAQRRPLQLGSVVEEAIKLLRSTLPAMIEIRVTVDWKTPKILADSTQIHQILMNLGTNAAHAMAERGGILSVTLDRSELQEGVVAGLKEGVYAHLTVSDNGSGMDAATLARVFEPFFTTKPQGQGTGLGLSVVHGIVSNHSGAIQAKSSLGIGTSFDLYFPATVDLAGTQTAPMTMAHKGAGEHILLIDDEAAVSEVTRHQLEKLGYRVTAFQDSSKAVAAFTENPTSFDAVLSDLSMPFISGLEVVSAIRKSRPDLPVVLASGFFQTSDHEAAKKLGVKEFLTKPFSSTVLGTTFGRVFSSELVAAPPVA